MSDGVPPTASRRARWIAGGVMAATLGTAAGCTTPQSREGTAVRDGASRAAPPGTRPLGTLGAGPESLGITVDDPAGSGVAADGRQVRWEPVGGQPTVVAVAELWDPPARDAFLARGLRAGADDYARRFGGADAEFVSSTTLGGVDALIYRSGALAVALRSSPDPSARAGRFVVALTRTPGPEGASGLPIATDPDDPRKVPAGTFSVAVVAGNPWSAGDAPSIPEQAADEVPIAGPARIVLTGHSYLPSLVTVRAGQALLLALENPDAGPHDLNLMGLARPVHLFLNGRKAIQSSVTFPRPGRYPFFCSVDGHRAAGMEGAVVVEG